MTTPLIMPPGVNLQPPSRWWQFVTEGQLFCGPKPHGHHIKNAFDLTESGFIRCNHWVEAERRECGLWVFAYAVRGGRVVVARVTLDEKRAMKQLQTPAQMIDYLGIWKNA